MCFCAGPAMSLAAAEAADRDIFRAVSCQGLAGAPAAAMALSTACERIPLGDALSALCVAPAGLGAGAGTALVELLMRFKVWGFMRDLLSMYWQPAGSSSLSS